MAAVAYGEALVLPLERRTPWWGLIGGSAVTAAFAALCFGPSWPNQLVAALPVMLFSGALVAAAFVLHAEPGQAPSARALVATALLWPTYWASAWPGGPWALISLSGPPIGLVLLAWAVYRYPDPAQVGRPEMRFLGLLAGWMVAGRLALVLTSRPEWLKYDPDAWWISLHADHGWYDVLSVVAPAGDGLFVIPFLVQWFSRIQRLPGRDRRLLRPLVAAGATAALASALCPAVDLLGGSGLLDQTVYGLQGLLLLTVPIALAYAVAGRRVDTLRVAGLVDRLWRDPRPENVERAFRSVLGSDLEVGYWAPERGGYLDSGGRTVVRPGAESSGPAGTTARSEPRLVREVATPDGEPLALLLADPALARNPELLDAAVAAGVLALQNARLQVDARAQLAEVRVSRDRLVEAGVAERWELRRVLQNGAVARIQAIQERLAKLEATPGEVPPELVAVIATAREQLARARVELDEIAQGLHPRVLEELGLAAAVRRMAAEQPLPVEVELPTARLPSEAEVAAYYVISEALTNAVRHAGASGVLVHGARIGDVLEILVSDDGRGGADPAAGTGLSGLAERIGAAGGELSVVSPPGGGTTVRAEIPCG
jgi:signal transduction histidine kinase